MIFFFFDRLGVGNAAGFSGQTRRDLVGQEEQKGTAWSFSEEPAFSELQNPIPCVHPAGIVLGRLRGVSVGLASRLDGAVPWHAADAQEVATIIRRRRHLPMQLFPTKVLLQHPSRCRAVPAPLSVQADTAKEDCRASKKWHASERNCAFVCKLTSSVFHLSIH